MIINNDNDNDKHKNYQRRTSDGGWTNMKNKIVYYPEACITMLQAGRKPDPRGAAPKRACRGFSPCETSAPSSAPVG